MKFTGQFPCSPLQKLARLSWPLVRRLMCNLPASPVPGTSPLIVLAELLQDLLAKWKVGPDGRRGIARTRANAWTKRRPSTTITAATANSSAPPPPAPPPPPDSPDNLSLSRLSCSCFAAIFWPDLLRLLRTAMCASPLAAARPFMPIKRDRHIRPVVSAPASPL